MAKVISLSSAKGGVGKSSCTVELASAIKDISGKKVLVVDLDENCSLSKNVGADLTTGKTIYEVLKGICTPDEAVQHNELFDIMVGSKSLSLAAIDFCKRDDIYLMADLVDIMVNDYHYDYIFIDNAPSRSVLLNMTYVAADYIIIPTLSDDSSMDMIEETEDDIAKLVNGRNHESHAQVIGYILNSYKRSVMYDIAMEKLEAHAANRKDEIKPFVAFIKEMIKMSEVKTLHTSVYNLGKSSPISRSFYDIAQKVLEREDM